MSIDVTQIVIFVGLLLNFMQLVQISNRLESRLTALETSNRFILQSIGKKIGD